MIQVKANSKTRFSLPNLVRHFDLIQNIVKEELAGKESPLSWVPIDLNAPIEEKPIESQKTPATKENKNNSTVTPVNNKNKKEISGKGGVDQKKNEQKKSDGKTKDVKTPAQDGKPAKSTTAPAASSTPGKLFILRILRESIFFVLVIIFLIFYNNFFVFLSLAHFFNLSLFFSGYSKCS